MDAPYPSCTSSESSSLEADPYAATAQAIRIERLRFQWRDRRERWIGALLASRPMHACVPSIWAGETGNVPVGADMAAYIAQTIGDAPRALMEAMWSTDLRDAYVRRYAAARARYECERMSDAQVESEVRRG